MPDFTVTEDELMVKGKHTVVSDSTDNSGNLRKVVKFFSWTMLKKTLLQKCWNLSWVSLYFIGA